MRAIDADAFVRKIRKQYCEDCVRRKGIKNGKMQYLYEIGGVPCRACEIEDMLNEVEDAPTIQPEPHWIPVAERLPEENQPVLITDGAVMWVCSLIRTDDGYKWESNMGYWHDFDEWKAWMPLPEPYKGVTT